ncbi:galectin-4 isoform X2 [Kogia breviceps]|uniref:galectin-4 isoform X2 n=1 Tax=Kogia breviceps TaxID=27615 RepID=UPI0034D23F67
MAFVPAPGYQPTYNPTLPYHRPIPGNLRVGMSIYIQGVANEHMKRFFVNFEVGQGPEADVAFHFNPRFDGWDKVVFNTKQNRNWGKEEKKRSMPFSKGAAFELVFMVLAEHYKVGASRAGLEGGASPPQPSLPPSLPSSLPAFLPSPDPSLFPFLSSFFLSPFPLPPPFLSHFCFLFLLPCLFISHSHSSTLESLRMCFTHNILLPCSCEVVVNGNPFYEFGHRIPLQMVTHLHVDGDLQLQSINFIGGQPAPCQIPVPNPAYPPMEGPPTFNPPVPFNGRLQGGLTARRTIIVKGYVPPTAKSFVINFKVGSSGDLALHINPRLNEGTVVRNSFLNGLWGAEERKVSYNPFGPGKFFDLSIRCGMDRFKVYANGQHLFDFSHRLSAFQRVDMVEIQGDVTLSYVQI